MLLETLYSLTGYIGDLFLLRKSSPVRLRMIRLSPIQVPFLFRMLIRSAHRGSLRKTDASTSIKLCSSQL